MAAAAENQTESFHTYQLVDDIPEVAAARQSIRLEARQLLEERRAASADQPAEAMLLPVDALSTADKVITAREAYGMNSPEHEERSRGLLLDCQRLVAEWYRKKTSEYFPPSRHVHDPASQDFFSHGLSIRQMTENALVPIADDAEEEDRRVNERVEDATPNILRRLGGIALVSQAIRTISECTDSAISAYAEDVRLGRKHRGYRGYVPEIAKVMIRDIRLDAASTDRFEEQLALPGIYLTHEIITMAIERGGATARGLSKTALHGSQLLVHDDILAFAERLDTVASEQWCTNVFMGEQVPAGFNKDYAGFREAALRRQEGLLHLSETVATFVLDLAEDKVDRTRALVLVEDFVKKLLLDIGKQDTVAAELMFDKQTAQGLQQVAYLESIGLYEDAFMLMERVEQAAPGGGFCGAGSCDLVSVNLRGEAGQELAKLVKAESGDTVVKDKARACKCGSKSIVYAYSSKKVNKYCESCGAFESRVNGAKVA